MNRRTRDPKFSDMWKRGSNGIWYVNYYSPKTKCSYERSLGTEERALARRRRKKVLEDLIFEIEGRHTSDPGDVLFERVLERFERTRRNDLSENTKIVWNRIKNNYLLPMFGHRKIKHVDDVCWQKAVDEWRETSPKISLYNQMKYLRSVLNYAQENGYIPRKVKLYNPDANRPTPHYEYTEQEIVDLMRILPKDWQHRMILALEMAMRDGEIRNLRWDQVNLVTREIHLQATDTKTRKPRVPVMTENVFRVLSQRHSDNEVRSPWVFPGSNPRNAVSKNGTLFINAKRKLGIPGRWHDLRHTALTRMFRNSNNYAAICAFAGVTLEVAMDTYVVFGRKDMEEVAASFVGNAWHEKLGRFVSNSNKEEKSDKKEAMVVRGRVEHTPSRPPKKALK